MSVSLFLSMVRSSAPTVDVNLNREGKKESKKEKEIKACKEKVVEEKEVGRFPCQLESNPLTWLYKAQKFFSDPISLSNAFNFDT